MSVDLRSVCARVSVGALCPSMKIEYAARKTMALDGEELVPVEQPAIVVTMDVVDAHQQDLPRLPLLQSFAVPESALASEEACAAWILGRLEVVMLHELREFFRFDGEVLRRTRRARVV